MTSSPMRRATLALLPLAALVLAACGPTVAPAPPALRASTTNGGRTGWPIAEKDRYVQTLCTGSYDDAVETCHLTYKPYQLDTTNGSAHATAVYIATHPYFTTSQCTGNLAAWHSGQSLNPQTLQSKYPGVSGTLAENLFCYFFVPTSIGCASANLGATKAIDGWRASPSHRATMDAFAGKFVNGGAYCDPVKRIYVAVAQFHG